MLTGIGNYGVTATIGGARDIQVRASGLPGIAAGNTGGGGGHATTASAVGGIYNKQLLEDFVAHTDETVMRKMYRDIYNHDAISGSAVDLMSELPFSDFTLSSLPNQEMLQVFAKSLENINVRGLLPELTREYQVIGTFIAVTNFNHDTKMFASIMPQNIDYCKITPLPIYGRDPIIDLQIPKEMSKLLTNPDPRIRKAFDQYGEGWKKILKNNVFPLDPENTIYLPRRSFTTTQVGMSYFKRIVPIWLLEKALLRGTIDLAYRRQRPLLWLTCGDEEWEATNPEISQIVDMFVRADIDPIGGIVGTRPGIAAQELRDGANFWRYDEMYDFFSSSKMRALGISDAFLSAEATYSNMETSLSVFLEQIRAFRDMITRKLFYQRLFPMISVENDFRIDNKHEVVGCTKKNKWVDTHRDKRGNVTYSSTIGNEPRMQNHIMTRAGENVDVDLTEYYMPKLQWHKTLKPEADQAYLEILNTGAQAGLPIPLRIWAAACGLSIGELMQSLREDVIMRTKVADYQKKLPKSPQDQAQQMFSGGATVEQVMAMLGNRGTTTTVVDRSFDGVELRDPKTHKVLSTKGRKMLEHKVQKQASIALANLARKENHSTHEDAEAARKRAYSFLKKPGNSSIFGGLK